MLAEIIGAEHLAIDPWPTFGTGHMSGWVKSECVFLNASASAMDRFAALSFIGYLLDPNVQLRFAEAGKIPSVLTTRPRDPLIMQAIVALADGVSFPNAVEEQILSVYWNELDAAIQGVFKGSAIPSVALQQANDNIRNTLAEIKTKQAAP
jgi:maltose-binding protein MalE